jgi:hypothetical protein
MSQIIDPLQLSAVSARGSRAIRELSEKVASLESENQVLRDKVASLEREKEIEILASEMEEKGLSANLSFDEKVASLRRYDDLSRVREAVKLAASGIPIASVTDDQPGRGTVDPLTSFCLGGE